MVLYSVFTVRMHYCVGVMQMAAHPQLVITPGCMHMCLAVVFAQVQANESFGQHGWLVRVIVISVVVCLVSLAGCSCAFGCRNSRPFL